MIFQRLHTARSIPAPASAWPSARRSSSATAGGSGWSPSPARAATFYFHHPGTKGGADVARMRTSNADRDPAGRGQPRRRAPDAGGPQGRQGPQPPERGRATASRRWPSCAARAATPRRRAPTSSCSTSTCRARTAARCWPRSRADADLQRIPVVVLTTSQAEEDIVASLRPARQLLHHQAGRPRAVHRGRPRIEDFWLAIVTLPTHKPLLTA